MRVYRLSIWHSKESQGRRRSRPTFCPNDDDDDDDDDGGGDMNGFMPADTWTDVALCTMPLLIFLQDVM